MRSGELPRLRPPRVESCVGGEARVRVRIGEFILFCVCVFLFGVQVRSGLAQIGLVCLSPVKIKRPIVKRYAW